MGYREEEVKHPTTEYMLNFKLTDFKFQTIGI